MKCSEARLMLGLYVAGDLPEGKIAELKSHLSQCAQCSAEFEELKVSHKLIKQISEKDIPDTLPDNFSHRIRQMAAREQKDAKKHGHLGLSLMRKKPALIFAGIAAAAVLIVAGLLNLWNPANGGHPRIVQLILNGQGKISWNEFDGQFAGSFEGPIKLNDWEPENLAAAFAVMERTANRKSGETYKIIYCGEGRSLAAIYRYPWIDQRIKRLADHAGSKENLYVAIYPMPGSSKLERQKVEAKLIRKFRPYFNVYKGV